ncbi:hypothetical protein HY382_02770 [Candidatus Curtissbacteria bacterium]|nr:hypothetical protein [Candidatus Curtissbacteria bacterium]
MKERFPVAGYNWLKHETPDLPVREPRTHVGLNDEALRDGQQALVETEPPEEEKKAYIQSTSLFAEKVDLGFPGSSKDLEAEIVSLAKFIRDQNINIKPMVTGRGSSREDIGSILNVARALDGFGIEAYIFLDVSKERAKHEGWDRNELIDKFVSNTKLLVAHNIPVGVVLERWSRTSSEDQEEFIEMNLGEGARFITLADTQGIHNERSLKNELRWTFEKFGKNYPEVEFDAHFHNQRGLAVANSLVAAAEGIDRIHVTPGGIGEGAGNTDYVALLVNLNMDGYRDDALRGNIGRIKDTYSIFGIDVPKNAPFHKGAFESASGVHQSTFYKAAHELGSLSFYFCISPDEVDEKPTILLNRISGRAGVKYVLEVQEKLETNESMIDAVLEKAKNSRSVLSRENILESALRYNVDKE